MAQKKPKKLFDGSQLNGEKDAFNFGQWGKQDQKAGKPKKRKPFEF
ncbi:MAG: hypothetical protein WC489_06140 [Patescibacteria group bacterium]|jgi:hypothetical protein